MNDGKISVRFTCTSEYFSENIRIRFSHAYVLYSILYYRYYNYFQVNFITFVTGNCNVQSKFRVHEYEHFQL